MWCFARICAVRLEGMKYTRGGVLLLVKLQALACSFAKIKTPPWVFFAVLNCGDKLREASHM